MRSKTLISTTAFFAAFVFSAAFAGLFVDTSASSNSHIHHFHHQYDAVTADAIEDFLLKDISNGTLRDRQLYSLNDTYAPPFGTNSMDEYTDVIENYSNKSGSLEDANLPRDVRRAWHEHMQAWRDYSGFLRVSGDLNYTREELRIRDMQYENDINRTWYNVLRISRTYGAYVPY